MPRKTDSSNPADWLFIAGSDLEGLQILAKQHISYSMCRSKLAEVVEKVIKAELLRMGWFLEKPHDLEKLLGELRARKSDLELKCEPLCEALAEAYFADRYPGFDVEDPDWPRMLSLLEQTAELLGIVKGRLAAI